MAGFLLQNKNNFPNPDTADEDGLLAIGSNFDTGTLLKAYRRGIFPWFNEGKNIFWYHPDPRFVLFPEKLKISHSIRNVMNKKIFRFTVNKAFSEVIKNCKISVRKNQPETWITDEFEFAYNSLYQQGYACSAETWENNELVGGLYGVLIGKVFFGESMFSKTSNASKFAFIKWVEFLQKNKIELIDCQVYTQHLASFGAELIPRKIFINLLDKLIVE
ncbi:MAG: leucyl/phenylalanyl-tRNA--protein transferase [Bacteroidota bacterium]|nr:leucyl/phenylalanyl-tRNA--protein transferase [Bacteroidota bacterium]